MAFFETLLVWLLFLEACYPVNAEEIYTEDKTITLLSFVENQTNSLDYYAIFIYRKRFVLNFNLSSITQVSPNENAGVTVALVQSEEQNGYLQWQKNNVYTSGVSSSQLCVWAMQDTCRSVVPTSSIQDLKVRTTSDDLLTIYVLIIMNQNRVPVTVRYHLQLDQFYSPLEAALFAVGGGFVLFGLIACIVGFGWVHRKKFHEWTHWRQLYQAFTLQRQHAHPHADVPAQTIPYSQLTNLRSE